MLFDPNNWWGSFTANLLSEVIVVVILGFFILKWVESLQRRKEKKENHKVIASLIAAELEHNRKQLKRLIELTPKGDVIFPCLATSAWDSIDKPDFISFYKPHDLADILNIYRRTKAINTMYESLLESSNWAVSGRVTIVRREFLDIFIKHCDSLLIILNEFFAGIERKRDIKKAGLKYKGITVKKKPKLWDLIPWLFSYTAQAIYPNIFVSERVWENLSRIRSNAYYVAALEHEKKHIERQKKLGFFNFGVKYLFLPKFRFKEELFAIKASMKYLKEKKLNFDIEGKAKFLSSWLYLWMISYDRAKEELEKAWEDIK